MSIKMKIVEVHPTEHSVVVRYFTDKITEEMLAVSSDRNADGTPVRCRTDSNVSILQVPAPTGQALIDYILSVSPPSYDWLGLQEKIVDPAADTSMTGVGAALNQVVLVPPKPVPPDPPIPEVRTIVE